MSKYQVTTDKGVYEVTTEDAQDGPNPLSSVDVYSSPGRVPGQMEKNQAYVDKADAATHQAASFPSRVWQGMKDFNPATVLEAMKPPQPQDSPAIHAAYAAGGPLGKIGAQLAGAQIDQGSQAYDYAKAGRPSEAFGHAVAAVTPGGPMWAHMTETAVGEPQMPPGQQVGPLRAPDYARVAGMGIDLLAPMAIGKMLPKEYTPLSNRNTPEVQQALNSVATEVPISAGQATGHRALQRVEQGMENLPGSSGTAQDFFRGQEDALANAGRNRTAQLSPTQTNTYGAGQGVMDRVANEITGLKSQANTLYDEIRKDAAGNTKTVQVGTSTSPIVTPSGQAIATPVMQTLESPVDLAPLRQQLAPIYEDIQRSMPEARRAASPAFKALDDLMTSKDPTMNAIDFDRSLGAIKSLARDGNSPYLTSQSQGIAKQIIKAGETQLEQALPPGTYQKLGQARQLVRGYHDTADLLTDLGDEPAAVYQNLTSGGDRVANTLKTLNKIAPDQLKTVGRTFVDGLLDTATSEGGFRRAQGIMAKWERLGPETKKLMFGSDTQTLNDFMLAAKKLTEVKNPSGTGPMLAALGGLGEAGMALWSLIHGDTTGMAASAGTYAGTKALSKMLMTPGGVKALTTAMKLPVGGGKALTAASATNAGPRSKEQLQPMKSPEDTQ